MKIQLSESVALKAVDGMYADPQAIQEWLSGIRKTVAKVDEEMSKVNRGHATQVELLWNYQQGAPKCTVIGSSES